MAGLPTLRQPSLNVGTMLPTGAATPDIAIAIGSQAQADHWFGQGSELSRMFVSFFKNNFANEVWGLPVAEPVGAVAASGTITVAMPPEEAGTIHLYIGGQHTATNIGATDTADEVATALAATINDDENADLPVVATVGGTTTGSGTGTGAGTDLTMTAVTGTIAIGATVTGTGVPGGTTIVSQTSGTTGKDGVYVTSQATTASAAALNFSLSSPTNAVTLTAKWKGVGGNDISVLVNYFGRIGGEELPFGLELTLPASGFLTGGTAVPDFDTAIANLGDQQFEYVAMPFTDSTSLLAWEEEFGFSETGRWGWMRELFGHVFSAKRDTYTNLMTWGPTRNSGVISVMAIEPKMPNPVYEITAAYTAKAQRALTNDPARPLQTLALNGIKNAPLHDRFNTLEINSLAGVGFATQKAGFEGSPLISRESTTYQLNLYGQPDDAYELVTTLATLARLMRNQKHAITSKYPRHKLANDGTRYGAGQAIVTPGVVKAELIAQYRLDEFNGLVEDVRNFKRHLLVERDPNNPNRLNVLYPPDLINQLRIFAVLNQFRLQYDRGVDVEIIGQIGVTARPIALTV
jgi:phage tail sheath gpL-like